MPEELREDLGRLAKVWTKRDRGAIQWTLSSVVRKLAVEAIQKIKAEEKEA